MIVCVTLSSSVQITEDKWYIRKISNTFSDSATFTEVLKWAREQYEEADLYDLEFTKIVE